MERKIVNPIDRHKKKLVIEDLNKSTAAAAAKQQTDVFRWSRWEEIVQKIMAALNDSHTNVVRLYGNNLFVKIHDHMRGLAVRIVEEDHPEWAYDISLDANSCELPDASDLKLLRLYCECDAMELRDFFLKDLNNLNVLEFTNLQVALSLPSSKTQLDHLWNLGTLCLHNCSLGDISIIGELKGLHILSFRGSDICKLPIQLKGLIALKMLDLGDCEELTQIEPNVLGSLTKLEELNMENGFKDREIEGGDAPPSNASLIELKNMSLLSNVRIHIPSTSMLPKDGKLFSSKLTMYQIMFGVAQKSARELSEERLCFDLFCDTDEESISYPHELSGEDSGFYRKLGVEYNKFSRVLMLTFDSPDILWQDWVQATLQTTDVLYLSGRLDEKCESIDEICIQGFECLKHIRMRNCPSFRFITSSNDWSSTNLESLYLESLESLEKLCGGLPRHEKAFSKLRFMKIDGCNKLTYLFSFSLLKRRLFLQLEEIIVNQCSEIQCIVVSEDDNNSDDVVTLSKLLKLEFRHLRNFSDALFGGKKVTFPCLEYLTIYQLDELEHIWHPTDPPTELGKLRLLHVEGCHKLVRVINSNVLMRVAQHLESLRVEDCGLMKEVFDVDDAIISSCYSTHDLVFFSQLKVLRLQKMKRLEGVNNSKNLIKTMIMKGGGSMTIFPNIELLEVSDCHHLRYVLCCSLPATVGFTGVAGYENLKDMRIRQCDAMEAIVEVILLQQQNDTASTLTTGDQNVVLVSAELVLFCRLKYLYLSRNKSLKCIYSLGGSRDNRSVLTTTFPNIESIYVSDCHDLRYVLLLPRRAGAGLVHLRQLTVRDCYWMEAIVMISGTLFDEETQPAAYAHKNYDVSYSYSSLKEMRIYRCPQLRTFCQYRLSSEQDSAADNLPFFCQEENYMPQLHPCLESLSLEELGIVHGGGHSTNIVDEEESTKILFTFPSLRTLELKYLRNFESFYSSSSACACGFQFPSLETLQIRYCSRGVKTLFSLDSDMVGALFRFSDMQLAMPNLKSIDLYGLENLTKIWKGEEAEGLFLKLESLRFEGCSSSCTNFQSLLSVGVVASLSCWNVLTELVVSDCDGLEYLLTPLGASNLVHLTSLYIGYCKNIKEVVVSVDQEKAAAASNCNDHIRDITFSHLKKLDLFYLPRLEKFSSINNMVLNFPSLEILDIGYSHNMTTFSSGIAKASTQKFGDLNSFVHKIYAESSNTSQIFIRS